MTLDKAKGGIAKAIVDEVESDWFRIVENDTENFDVLIYLPMDEDVTADQQTELDQSFGVVGEDEQEQQTLYTEALSAKAVEFVEEQEPTIADDFGGLELPQVITLKLNVGNVAEGSLIEFAEIDDDGNKKLATWYVIKIEKLGRRGYGSLYRCIPFAGER